MLPISIHNDAYRNGSVAYKLSPNQFTDTPFEIVKDMFPPTTAILEKCRPTSSSFSKLFQYTRKEIENNIYDQGFKCNAGWAYAVQAAFEDIQESEGAVSFSNQYLKNCPDIFNELQNSCLNNNSALSFSHSSKAHSSPHFKCVTPTTLLSNIFAIRYHFTTCEANLVKLGRIIQNITPIIFEINQLSFEFIHYSEGIFTQPDKSAIGSHYMVAVAIKKDSEGRTFWKLQNSFGKSWGEKGFMRLINNDGKNIRDRVIVPYFLLSYKQFRMLYSLQKNK